jgi:hypothetical protein
MAVREDQRPVVDLRTATGAENPPCPACGDPLFGWALLRPGEVPVRRCETCGLGLLGAAAEREEALAALARFRAERHGSAPNRASTQAWIGQSGWSALEQQRRFLLTPEAVWRLDGGPVRSRAAVAAMWQTLLNSFTFGHNVALGRLGRATATEAAKGWQRGLDLSISLLAAPLLIVIAAPLELGSALAGRGGSLELSRTPAR